MTNLEWWESVGYIILLFNIGCVLLIILRGRKSATATWAWILVMLTLPLAGLMLYLLFGRELKSERWNSADAPRTQLLMDMQQNSLSQGQLFQHSQGSRQKQELVHMLLHANYSPLTEDNQVELITDGKAKFDQLYEDIQAARHSVYIQYYSIAPDEIGRPLIELLTKKADEGLDVFLLYDGLGSIKLTKQLLEPLRQAGGWAEPFFPLRSALFKASLNHRNHRKLVIIDQTTGYMGGFNIGRQYVKKTKKFGYWRDSHLRLRGGSVYLLQDYFISDWNKGGPSSSLSADTTLPKIRQENGVAMQLVQSGPDMPRSQIKGGFLKMIQEADDYIYIQTPYFIPDLSLLESLRIAVLSGRDVRIMIPNKPDHLFVYWATSFFVGELLREGASVYMYEDGFLHAKTMVIDDHVSTLGTANMDIRSLRINFELNAFMYDQPTAHKMKSVFESDQAVCRELTWDEYQKRSAAVRMKENFSRLLAPLL
ncbi:cardiolipin synthase [Marinococcus luteus]|uniref:cardiolipin synthase n=1 Tax=Marinococcus luteus TaxID=1122204 RepID=UPI002ACCC15F|nr:cardiolipin synthase [Marinococcus luteus]MDZ5782058.1 cardiolipin synthase [Marinococcus luteus]